MIDLQNGDCLELMKKLPNNSVDLIFTDPPYALGSEIIIKSDGKPDYKKAIDFMNKWEMPDGNFWQEWYKEAFRVLKYGGHCAMFGIDRQTFLFQYYAVLNGFQPKQSLYWYFISNFPKASDLSKNIDKRFGLERELVKENIKTANWNNTGVNLASNGEDNRCITAPNHPLAQKYNGMKCSVAPLKQTCEEIMVFQKPYKHGSCLNDVLAYEEGDETITVGALDIEGNRVATNDTWSRPKGSNAGLDGNFLKGKKEKPREGSENGKYPAQTFIDSGTAEVLDQQSGISKGSRQVKSKAGSDDSGIGLTGFKIKYDKISGFTDSGGCSRILHKCDYEDKDFDLFIYNPKVSKSERNEGLEGFEEKESPKFSGGEETREGKPSLRPKFSNFHPTVKPTKLLTHILKLFKTPNPQTILDPFMGSGSMGISAVECDYDYIGYELDGEYFKIAKARINNAQNKINSRLL